MRGDSHLGWGWAMGAIWVGVWVVGVMALRRGKKREADAAAHAEGEAAARETNAV